MIARDIANDVIDLYDGVISGLYDEDWAQIRMIYLYVDAEYWRVVDEVRNIILNETVYNTDFFDGKFIELPF